MLLTQSQDDVGGRYFGQKYARALGRGAGTSLDAVVSSAMGSEIALDEVVAAEDTGDDHKAELLVPRGARVFVAW